MNILCLHISDIHIKEDDEARIFKIDKIINALSYYKDISEIILVISGDIAFSGKAEEYEIADAFIEELKISLCNKFSIVNENIHIFVVPGNHDVDFSNNHLAETSLEDILNEDNYDSLLASYLNSLLNFFNFANKYNCFKRDKNFELNNLKFTDLTISIELYNTAPFSLLGGEILDKGQHYIDDSVFLDQEQHNNLRFSIMHHNPEWFRQSNKESLINYLFNSKTIVFCGHEHYEIAEERRSGNHLVNISNGGCLRSQEKDPSFNVVHIDTLCNIISIQEYKYNGRIFKPQNEQPFCSNIALSSTVPASHTEKFKNELEEDISLRKGMKFLNYFVFPVLSEHSYNEKRNPLRLQSINEFRSILNNHKTIKIAGEKKSGKTILSKYLTISLSNSYIPILLTIDDFKKYKISNILKYSFNEQYGNSMDYDEFLQYDSGKKILIIDDVDKVDNKKFSEFINKYSHYFGFFIYFSSRDYDINIAKNAYEEILNEDCLKLDISPFLYKQRFELIRKECRFLNVDEDRLEGLCGSINNDIFSEVGHFSLTPDFLLLYINDYVMENRHKSLQNKQNVFSRVYETSISQSILNQDTRFDLDEIYEYLKFVAFHMYSNNEVSITLEDLKKVINNCNSERALDLDATEILKVLQSSNILIVNEDNKIRFSEETLLAYFTALSIQGLTDINEKNAHISKMLENLSAEIYRDIILFYSYISGEIDILLSIKESIEIMVTEWEELDFACNDISFLNNYNSETKTVKLPSAKEKENYKEKKSETEKRIIESKKKRSDDIFNFNSIDKDSFESKVLRVLYYLDIIAKMLPSFRTTLEASDKKDLINILYCSPNKVLHYMFTEFEKNIKDLINDILCKCDKAKQEVEITEELIKETFKKQAIICICSIFGIVAVASSTGKGLKELNTFDYSKKINYRLLNLMMEAQSGNIRVFFKKAIDLHKSIKDSVYIDVVAVSILKVIYENDVNFKGDVERAIRLYFNKVSDSQIRDLYIDAKRRKSIE